MWLPLSSAQVHRYTPLRIADCALAEAELSRLREVLAAFPADGWEWPAPQGEQDDRELMYADAGGDGDDGDDESDYEHREGWWAGGYDSQSDVSEVAEEDRVDKRHYRPTYSSRQDPLEDVEWPDDPAAAAPEDAAAAQEEDEVVDLFLHGF